MRRRLPPEPVVIVREGDWLGQARALWVNGVRTLRDAEDTLAAAGEARHSVQRQR